MLDNCRGGISDAPTVEINCNSIPVSGKRKGGLTSEEPTGSLPKRFFMEAGDDDLKKFLGIIPFD
jgi:hypothetical protein